MRARRAGPPAGRAAKRSFIDFLVFAGMFTAAIVSAAYALAVIQSQRAWPAEMVPSLTLLHERGGDADHVQLTITPPKAAPAATPREMILIVDTSSSMAGAAIAGARASVLLALDTLQAGDRFNIIRFAHDHEALASTPLDVSPETLERGRRFAAGLTATGGTDILPPLRAALADATPSDPRVRQIILLTDGSIANGAQALSDIAGKRGRTRLFIVGLGAAPDGDLMGRAAELGRGSFIAIRSHHRLPERMAALLERIERPVVTDLRLEWPSGVRTEAWPEPLPDLYGDGPVTVVAQLSAMKGEITVTGRIAGRPWQTQLRLSEAQHATGIAQAWAQRKIAAIEARRFAGQDAAMIAAAAREIALKHGLEQAHAGTAATGKTIVRDGQTVPPPASGSVRDVLGERLYLFGLLIVMFGGMCAVTIGFWSHLRREYASPRRSGGRA